MKLQNLTVIFIIITLPIILLVSLYINVGLKTIRYQALYDTGLLESTQDAILAFESNTVNNNYSGNPEEKRSIIKSSIKMFETSLCNTCNISAYNLEDIEVYIPAMVFGMYDGFYLYAPSLNSDNEYKHSLKNYVYYSELLDKDDAIVIRYYLDSYVQVSGYFAGNYESKEGFLLNVDEVKFKNSSGAEISADDFLNEYQRIINDTNPLTVPSGNLKIIYYNTEIDVQDEWAVNYFYDNYIFSHWFTKEAKIGDIKAELKISNTNDPEDPNSEFVKHKNEIIREKIEGVLNSTITAYSERTWGQNYKMPKLTEEEWERIYSDISLTTFFQGKRIGFTKYNGYCVLNSNSHYELVNPNLLYFTTDEGGDGGDPYTPDGQINSSFDYYHDIRCEYIPKTNTSKYILMEEAPEARVISTLRGWKIGRFKKVKVNTDVESGREGTGPALEYKDYSKYMYERAECACYECINGSLDNAKTVYEYINIATDDWTTAGHASEYLTISYWTSLARERAKLNQKDPPPDLTVTKQVAETLIVNGGDAHYTITVKNNAAKTERVTITDKVIGTDEITIKSIDECRIGATIYDGVTVDNLQSSDGFSVELKQGETFIIRYTASLTDKEDSGTEVTNQVKASVVYEGSEVSEPDWTKEATCNTIETKLAATKTVRKDGAVVDKVEYGDEVEYEIRITNISDYDVTDKITIEDTFLPSQLTNIRDIKYNGYGDGSVRKEASRLVWEGKEIGWHETITITFKATLKGEIGDNIKNYVVAISEYGARATAEDEIYCKAEKTIKMEGAGGGDYHVILVLDASSSMVGKFDNVKKAAKKLIYGYTDSSGNYIQGLGEDRVTIVNFAQNATVLDTINLYPYVLNGISTNYVAGLDVARGKLKSGVNNYVVFMSDGGPTNTQGPDNDWSDQNIAARLLEALGDGVESIAAAVIGGWLELNWTGENTYSFKLLVTSIIESVLNLLGLNVNIAFGDLAGLARTVWQNLIMNGYVNPLKNLVKQMYTIYYNTGGGSDPKYGLSQMATSLDNFKDSDDYGSLDDIFTEITEDIKGYEIDEERQTENGVIRLRLYEDITSIKIGSRMLTASELTRVKNKIVPNGDGSGNLNLRDPEISNLFKTNEEITVMY